MKSIYNFGLLGLMLVAAPAMSFAAEISDSAGFFSAAAIEKANRSIHEIQSRSGHDVRIETYATVPAEKVDAVSKMTREAQQEYLHKWVVDRARELHETGALFLICKHPAHIEVWFSQDLKNAGLSRAEYDAAKSAMLTGFRDKDYDGALSSTVDQLSESFSRIQPAGAKNHRVAHNQPSPAPVMPVHAPPRHGDSGMWGVVFILGMVVFGIFLISLVTRGLGGGGYGPGGYGQPGYGGGYGYGGGGGGFMSSLTGGIFGALAGNWLYDSFSGHSAHAHDAGTPVSNTDHMSDNQNLGDNSNSQQSWNDEGGYSGGGWFDNSGGGSSGGDFGGGDFGGGGGGDFGGGDFGGGGDF